MGFLDGLFGGDKDKNKGNPDCRYGVFGIVLEETEECRRRRLGDRADRQDEQRDDRYDRQGQRQENHGERVETRSEEDVAQTEARQDGRTARTHDRAKFGYNPVGDGIDSVLGGLTGALGSIGSGIGTGLLPVAAAIGGTILVVSIVNRKKK